MEGTSQRIIDAAMELIRKKGYLATTTRDIARLAGVNECTLFRRFNSKKDIVIHGVEQEKEHLQSASGIYNRVVWELRPDLEMFMEYYMERVAGDFVSLSIGLHAPQIYEETAPSIKEESRIFTSTLIRYFEGMEARGKICRGDFEGWATAILAAVFGYRFLKLYDEGNPNESAQKSYIQKSSVMIAEGILHV